IRAVPPLRITVTAGRFEETARYSASSTGILDKDDIAELPIRSFDQALEQISGVIVRRNSVTSTSSVSIRGSSEAYGGGAGNRVLLLLDGRPMLNADVQGANWSYLPLGVVDRIEVVKGASSPLYGSTAMGGVVNIITRKPDAELHYGIKAEGGMYDRPPEWMRFKTDRTYYSTLTGDVSSPAGPLWLLGYYSRSTSGEYRQNGDMELHNGYVKVNYLTTDVVDMTWSALAGKSTGGFSHSWLSVNDPLEVSETGRNDRYDRSWWDIDFTVNHKLNESSKIISKFYGHTNRAVTNYNPDGSTHPDEHPLDYKFDSLSRSVGTMGQYDRWCGGWFKHVLGADFSMDFVDGKPYNTSYGKHHAANAGGFLLAEFHLPAGFILSAAGRFDFRHDVGRTKDYNFSPRAGVVWKELDSLTLRASYSQAFRAPSFSELYLEEIAAGYKFRHDPDLKAEKVNYYEAGGNLNLSDRVNLDGAYFYQDWKDQISWYAETAADGLYLIPNNLERVVISGFDMGIYTNLFWGLSARTSYTYLNARDLSTGSSDETVPYKPEHNLIGGLDWAYFDWFRLHGDMRYRSEIEEAIIYDTGLPDAYTTYNASATGVLPWDIEIAIKVNNIRNTQYEEMAHYRLPGRSYGLTVSWRK
ncbi:MAG: TonB-dependent receptor, partial [bacterium]|nr:TonB-dependent receptor [bacterium]